MEEKAVPELRIWETDTYLYDQLREIDFQLFTSSGLVFLWKKSLESESEKSSYSQKSLICLAFVFHK